MAVSCHVVEKLARDEEGRCQVLPERLVESLEGKLRNWDVLYRPHAVHRGADIDRAERCARLLEGVGDLMLLREVGPYDGSATELIRERSRALLAAVTVDHDSRAFGRERTSARAADPAGRAGDHDALSLKPGLDPA